MVTNASTPTVTRYTTLWGGSGIALAGLLSLVAILASYVPGWDSLAYGGNPLLPTASAIIFAVALWVLAFGVRGEAGIVGDSTIGKIGLVLFGLDYVVEAVLGLLSNNVTQGVARTEGYISLVFGVVGFAAEIAAAIAIVRAGILTGPIRWGFVIVVVWSAVTTAIGFAPALYLATTPWPYVIGLLLQIGLGAGYALYGQSESLRRGMETLNKHW